MKLSENEKKFITDNFHLIESGNYQEFMDEVGIINMREKGGPKVNALNILNFLKSVQHIDIIHNIEYLNYSIFYRCKEIKRIDMPDNIMLIGSETFGECGLESIKFSDNSKLMGVGYSAFFECAEIKEVDFPNGLIEIGQMAFACCYHLDKLVIPKSVKSIGEGFVAHCWNLEQIDFMGTKEEWENIKKNKKWGDQWINQFSNSSIKCSDGVIQL